MRIFNRSAAGALLGGVVLMVLSGCAIYPAYPAHQVSYSSSVYEPAYGPAPHTHAQANRYANRYPDQAYASNAPNAFPGNGQFDGRGAQAHSNGAYSNGVYSDSQGQVVDIRRISYRGNPQASAAAGTAIGGIVGGALGNSTGHHWNRSGNTLTGVLIGALLGSAIGTAASYQTAGVAYRVTARMDSGAIRAVDYVNPPGVRVGDRVGFDGRQFLR